MPSENIITGQHVSEELLERAKKLRRRMTPTETKLRQHLRAGRLSGYHFRRQQVIGRYIIDFYCHKTRLVIEIDGGVHLDQAEYDHERDQYLRSRGFHVLRFTNHDIDHSLEAVLTSILEACQQANMIV